jgi:tuftelin-interacting protein 11
MLLLSHAAAVMQDTATLLNQEKERLAKEVAAATAAADRLAGLTTRLAKARQNDASLSLQQLLQVYSDMAGSYPEEYVLYSLAAAALAQALPRMRALMAGWQPLLEPQRGSAELQAWRGLLESSGSRQNVLMGGAGWEDTGDPYATLVAEVVMAPIR